MQPFHTLKINPAGFKAIPVSHCGIGFVNDERQFLAFCKSSLFLTNSELLRGFWEEQDSLTLSPCLSVLDSHDTAPNCLTLWASTP